MNGWLIFYAIVLWIANIFFCAWLAGQKSRRVELWAFLGAILPGLAIVAIAGATNLTEHKYSTEQKPSRIITGKICPICKKEFMDIGNVIHHMSIEHPE